MLALIQSIPDEFKSADGNPWMVRERPVWSFLASQERVERRRRTHALCGRHQRRDKVRTADLTDRWTDVKAGCLCPV
jgi:hypothetical protein